MKKRFQKFLLDQLKTARDEESGVILLISVLAAATVAAAIGTATLLNSTGPRPEIRSTQGNASKLEKISQAINLYAIRDANFLLPCPASGSAANGVSIGACDSPGANTTGTVPWSTLGLSEEDALDAYGSQIVYAVSAGPLGVCHELDGVPTGSVTAGTMFAGDTTPGSGVLYALVSQGPNALGSYSSNGTSRPAPTSTEEDDNCPNGSGCTDPNEDFIDTGPFEDDGGGTSHFDDEVFLVSSSDFTTECENFAAGEKSELEFVEEGFGGSSVSSDLVVTNNGGGGGGSSSLENGTLSVTEDVQLSTTSTLFAPDVTTLYNRIEWTPTAAPTNTGFTIATRANISTRSGSTSDYTLGVSCQFFNSGAPGAQTIAIRADSGNLATSGADTYTLTVGQTYELECYDDGNNVWARITEVGNITNQATVFTTDTSDLTAPNQVIFTHSSTSGATSTLDNLLVAKGGIALELDNGGTLSNASTPLANFGTGETDFTTEGWLYVRDTIGGNVSMPRISDGLSSSESTVSTDVANAEFEFSFIDFDTSSGSLVAQSQTYGTTFWGHYAFNCNTGSDRSLYVFGSSVGTPDTTACDLLPGTDIATATETVSFVNNTGGRVLLSELRLWDAARGSSNIGSNFNVRVDNAVANLDLQLRLEDGFASSTAADAHTPAENYTVTNGRFVGFKSPFRSLAEDVCPGFEDTSDPYKCVYDGQAGGVATTATVSIPIDITEVLIKTWGGGGSTVQGVGGGGGHAEGRFSAVGADNVSGNSLLVTAGGGGPGTGAGGAGSGVRFSATTTTTLLIAGGGGGTGTFALAAGGGGGGAAGQDGTGSTIEGGGGTQLAGGTGSPNAGGAPNLSSGADGGNAHPSGTALPQAMGFGNGGLVYGTASGSGGGGYAGGGGGDGAQGESGGGGSGYFDPTNLTSGETNTGSAVTPGDSGDADRGTAGNGAATLFTAGNPGRVVICWSSACLP